MVSPDLHGKLITNIAVALCLFCMQIAACSNQHLRSHPEGGDQEVNGVVVSKLTKSEVDSLPFLTNVPGGSCTRTPERMICSINPDEAINWGAGFCVDNPATLHSAVSFTKVELIVNNNRISESLIFQRNETYLRQRLGYCHVWLVKLSNWRSRRKVTLESRRWSPLDGETYEIATVNVN